MKNPILVLTMLTLLIMSGCNKKQDVNAMLENSETKNEIFNAIASNHDYLMGFMENIQNNQHAMQMIKGDKKMMEHMGQGREMQMMMNDSTMMKTMMGQESMKSAMMQIMNDSTSMNRMMQMMHKEGIMSNECMQSCMKMMNKKK